MNERIDPREASIDGLIDWLGQQRRRDPAAPLAKLLSDHSLDQQRLVDVACIDLMQRRRMSHTVTVEDYLQEFPGLQSESCLLDLIDAELCIKAELGEAIDADEYARRFPDYASSVRELILLEAGDEAKRNRDLVGFDEAHAISRHESDEDSPKKSVHQSDDFSIDIAPSNKEPSKQLESWSQHPLDVPEWFIGNECVASSPGKWLIRGRDSVRGIPLALKVTELPVQVSEVQIKRILDACECAAGVSNSSWVAPRIAAVQQRHLGVIRPWLFSRPWREAAGDRRRQLRNLAAVAFAVQSAHQSGATHGGIHTDNLMMEHDGTVRIMDAATSQLGLQRWLSPAHRSSTDSRDITSQADSFFATLDERKSIDVQDLIRLIATAAVDWEPEWSNDLVAQLRSAVSQHEDACAEVGQILLRHADSDSGAGVSPNGQTSRTWRRRLAHWLTKND